MCTQNLDHLLEEVKHLRKHEYRKQTGLTIVEGAPEVRRAIQAKVPIQHIFLCRELFHPQQDELQGQTILEINREQFAAIAFGKRLKGILAIVKPNRITLQDLKVDQNFKVIVLESVEKPGNLGAVIRSADGAGMTAVIATEPKTDLYNHHVVRSSIGNIFHIPVIGTSNEELYEFFQSNKIKSYAATSRAEKNYTEYLYDHPTAILVGNEGLGLSDFWLNHCDHTIAIPMHGQGDCLNVAMSASILMYETMRSHT